MRNLNSSNDTSQQTIKNENITLAEKQTLSSQHEQYNNFASTKLNTIGNAADTRNTSLKNTRFKVLLFIESKEIQKSFIENLPDQYDYSFDYSDSHEACLHTLYDKTYDILVTDFCGLNKERNEAISSFKATSKNLAIIALTERSTESQAIDCLTSGADYVISAPFNPDYILACITVVMRWHNLNVFVTSNIGPFKFDVETKTLTGANLSIVRLTDREVKLLLYLLKYKGQIVSRADLLEQVWGYSNLTKTHTVETHIYRLRKKISTFVDPRSVIITEGCGYKLAT